MGNKKQLDLFVCFMIRSAKDPGQLVGPHVDMGSWDHHKPGFLLEPNLQKILGLGAEANTENPRRVYWADEMKWLNHDLTFAEQRVPSGSVLLVTDLTDDDVVAVLGQSMVKRNADRASDEAADRAADRLAESLKRRTVLPRRRDIEKGLLFIVMPMNPDDPALVDVRDRIVDAASSLGLSARRVDDVESTTRITDQIIAMLDAAEFVVADLTHARPNVFFEAGYAQGIGKVPIYIAREGTKLEFDLKDYPVIFFPNMRQLEERLIKRLKALQEGART